MQNWQQRVPAGNSDTMSSKSVSLLKKVFFFSATEGEPFIVNLNDEDNTQIIVIIGDRFLWEKDITGDILEKLDLKLLQMIEKCKTNGTYNIGCCECMATVSTAFNGVPAKL
jgi:hypothetical protein